MEFLSPDQEIYCAWNMEGTCFLNVNDLLTDWYLHPYLAGVVRLHYSTIQDISNKIASFTSTNHNQIVKVFEELNRASINYINCSLEQGMKLCYELQNGN